MGVRTQDALSGQGAHSRTRPRRPGMVIAVVGLLFAACSGPMLPFETETPPLVLTTIRHAGIADGRGRFRQLFCAGLERDGAGGCTRFLWQVGEEPGGEGAAAPDGRLSRRLRVAVVSGYGADCFAPLVVAFEDAAERLARLGARLEQVPVTAFGSVAQNAAIVRDAVLGYQLEPAEKVVLVGYSKGTADTIEALVRYPELADRVAAFVSIAGAVNGSPLAEVVPAWIEELVEALPGTRCHAGDRRALADLRPSRRLSALDALRAPLPVPTFSLAAFAAEDEISELLRPFWARLAAADPRNDGQLLWYDQVVPGSTLLGYLRGDHLAVAVPVAQKLPWLAARRIDRNDYPRAALLEAVLRLLDRDLGVPGGAAVSAQRQ